MGLFDKFGSKEKTPLSPYEHNTALFDRFYNDLKNDALPEVSGPKQSEIKQYTEKRNQSLPADDPLAGSLSRNLMQENNSIPVEVDIWVDKVYNHYFADLKPMMGLVHMCEGARKELYKYKGYTWHTISELYPTVHFD